MSILTPANTWSNIYEIATGDPVKGGPVSGPVDAPTDGHANASLQGLANRTEYLYQRMLPIGSVLPYTGTTAPTGFLLCNGASVSRTTYAALFAVISTRFGTVNGSTFNVPDMRGMFMRGWDSGAGVDPNAATRTTANFGGATGDSIGSKQTDAFKSHDHDTQYGVGTGGATAYPEAQTPTSLTGNISSEVEGGSETRPINLAFNFIIRADY